MATVILVRHGRTTANVSGVLAGRALGIALDEVGREQAALTGERLAVVPLVGLVSSPLERCLQTAELILERQAGMKQLAGSALQNASFAIAQEPGITECDYGDWQGKALGELAKEKLWSVVQSHPSAAVFPNGESLAAMQARAVEAIRRRDAAFEAEHGANAVWVAVSHGDIIKAVLADAYGMHLDLFQRINVGPASVSIVRYGTSRPSVISTNTDAGDLSWLRVAESAAGTSEKPDDAPVGGGAGHQPSTISGS
jgi:probable phosphomutase (TIGR03848 family)